MMETPQKYDYVRVIAKCRVIFCTWKSYHGKVGPFWNHTFELLEVVNLVQNGLFMGGLHDGDPLKSMIMLEL